MDLIVFKGKTSQTGIAFSNEFDGIDFIETSYSFNDIKELLAKPNKAVIPIWNSHKGEITESHALTMMFENDIRLYYLWPSTINFQCLVKPENRKYNDVISVSVAEVQCSNFIRDKKLNFVRADDTVDAYKKFSNTDNKFYAILNAAGVNSDNFDILAEKAENKLNFTTFCLLASPDSSNWSENDWGLLASKIYPQNRVFVGVEMPVDDDFSDSQHELFNYLVEDIESIDDIPKAIFVSNYNGSQCRILFEAKEEFLPPDVLTESGSDDELRIITNAGSTSDGYAQRSLEYLNNNEDYEHADFIQHVGKESCFFACRDLGILTHGYDLETTKIVVKKIINTHFEYMARKDKSNNPTVAEKLFIKYENDFLDNGVDFIEFTDITAE